MNWPDIFYRRRYLDLVSENLNLQGRMTEMIVELTETRARLDRATEKTEQALTRVADAFAARCGFGEVFGAPGSAQMPKREHVEPHRVSPLTAREVQRQQVNDFFEQLSAQEAMEQETTEVED